jgi:glycogen(starch) synthase
MKKKRILMIAWEYPPRIIGGLSRVVHGLSEEMVKQGHEVCVITMADPGAQIGVITPDEPGKTEYECVNGVHIYRVAKVQTFPDFHTKMAMFQFGIIPIALRLHAEEPFDIIHAHDWMLSSAVTALRETMQVPVVTTIHATEFGRTTERMETPTQFFVEGCEQSLVRDSERVIVNSNPMADAVYNRLLGDTSKVRVVPNAITISQHNCEESVTALRNKHGLPNGPVILFVGRLVHEKGAQTLIDAAPRLFERYPDATVIIAGSGYFEQLLRDQARDRGIGERVRFFGMANDKDLGELYKLASVFVAPSFYEPFGIVALEAMAAKVPLVTTRSGGLPEINLDGITGLTYEAGDGWWLGWQILCLLNEPEKTKAYVEAAYARVRDEYNWTSVTEKTVAVYDEAIAASK